MSSAPTAAAPRPGSTITVPGQGSVRVAPDVADLHLGVVSIRPTAAAARAAAADAMRAILDALAVAGVERRDLRTTLVGLDAVRDYSSPSGPTITGYQLTNTVEATIRMIETVGGVIDAALAAGATSMDGLTFHLDEPAEALAAARRLAVVDARARATTLAAEAGVGLGGVVTIVEGGGYVPGPPRPAVEFRAKAATAGPTTPVEGGTNELTIGLTVVFAIE
jgi:uncharacterized protein YggE